VSGERPKQKRSGETKAKSYHPLLICQGQDIPPQFEGETTMNKLFTSTLLTVVAVPFLMAAPSAAKKAQNTTTGDTTSTMSSKKVRKHVKKGKNSTKSTESSTMSGTSSKN